MKLKDLEKKVTITLDELALLCLNVDYRVRSETKDAVEDLSVELQKKYKFDTHEYRLLISKYLKGAT
jgi:hypothetical protein